MTETAASLIWSCKPLSLANARLTRDVNGFREFSGLLPRDEVFEFLKGS
jgi:hypothetical protein